MKTKFQNPVLFSGYRGVIKNSKFYTKINRKQTDQYSCLHIDSEQPKLLKDSIPYSQALRIKRISPTSKHVEHSCKELKQNNDFLNKVNNSEPLGKHIKTVEKLDRNKLVKGKKKSICTHIPLAITNNQLLKNIIKIIPRNWKQIQLTNP